DQVLITVGRFGPVKAGPLQFDDLWEELPGLLCARIEHAERGHFVAIAGASMHGSRKQVLVADPAVDGAFWCPYGVFRDSYRGDGVGPTPYWTESPILRLISELSSPVPQDALVHGIGWLKRQRVLRGAEGCWVGGAHRLHRMSRDLLPVE